MEKSGTCSDFKEQVQRQQLHSSWPRKEHGNGLVHSFNHLAWIDSISVGKREAHKKSVNPWMIYLYTYSNFIATHVFKVQTFDFLFLYFLFNCLSLLSKFNSAILVYLHVSCDSTTKVVACSASKTWPISHALWMQFNSLHTHDFML